MFLKCLNQCGWLTKSYEFLVTPEDRTKFASLWLGHGWVVAKRFCGKIKETQIFCRHEDDK